MSRDHLDTITYPRLAPQPDAVSVYVMRLLELASAKSGRAYELRQARDEMVQARTMIELGRADPPLDLAWTMADRERERRLLPVRFPLDRGLLGWRLLLVRRGDEPRFAGVKRLRDLAVFDAVQMHDWPDTAILRANGLPVQTGTQYETLFSMLARGRVDYFPRGLLEAPGEIERRPELGLVIEPRLLMYYRAPLYLFVSPSRPRLAADLLRGLEAAAADGSFDRLFRQHFGALIERHRGASRTALHLLNPELSTETSLAWASLWTTPAGLPAAAQGR